MQTMQIRLLHWMWEVLNYLELREEVCGLQTDQLERLVEKTAARIDRHVVSTLLDKYSIVSHCSAIKRYLLLSQVRVPQSSLK